VVRVHAGAITAEVVQFEAVGNRPYEALVVPAVSELSRRSALTATRKPPVAVAVDVALPDPAAALINDVVAALAPSFLALCGGSCLIGRVVTGLAVAPSAIAALRRSIEVRERLDLAASDTRLLGTLLGLRRPPGT
jgi:hypothetical protein